MTSRHRIGVRFPNLSHKNVSCPSPVGQVSMVSKPTVGLET